MRVERDTVIRIDERAESPRQTFVTLLDERATGGKAREVFRKIWRKRVKQRRQRVSRALNSLHAD